MVNAYSGDNKSFSSKLAGGGGGRQFEGGAISLGRALISKKGTFWSATNEGAASGVLYLLNKQERQTKA